LKFLPLQNNSTISNNYEVLKETSGPSIHADIYDEYSHWNDGQRKKYFS